MLGTFQMTLACIKIYIFYNPQFLYIFPILNSIEFVLRITINSPNNLRILRPLITSARPRPENVDWPYTSGFALLDIPICDNDI